MQTHMEDGMEMENWLLKKKEKKKEKGKKNRETR